MYPLAGLEGILLVLTVSDAEFGTIRWEPWGRQSHETIRATGMCETLLTLEVLAASLPALRPDKTVSIASSGQRMDDRQIRYAIEQGDDGLILDGFGLGNPSEILSGAVRDAVDSGPPVIVTSRTHAGTLNAIYENGGGQTLQDHGALSSEDLPAHKARIKLLLTLEATESTTGLREYFGSW